MLVLNFLPNLYNDVYPKSVKHIGLNSNTIPYELHRILIGTSLIFASFPYNFGPQGPQQSLRVAMFAHGLRVSEVL